jgi:cytoskeletal protein CcmA (bactofilin family)
VLKKFIPQPQKPSPSTGNGSSIAGGNEAANQPISREEPRPMPGQSQTPPSSLKPTPTTDRKPMAEHTGKDVLSSDVEIKGSIKFQKELLIDGKVEGEINSDGVLTIGENADIRGEVKTKSITVYGKVQGNITVAERCELKSRCTLQGDLKAARLVIEEGATFIGKSEVTSAGGGAAKTSAPRPEVVRNDESSAPKSAFSGARA